MSSPYPDATTAGATVQYAYMFEKDKGPTKQFDAFLRAVARHVVLETGDKSDTHLTPNKLAAFYKEVGGNYDALFVDMPHASISYIWQVTGCQHTLQPTGNDFEAPSIPALTFRGFSRWESLEVLLGPEEHVPFLQYAAKNWNLKHPETDQDFPADLPASCFPLQADKEVDRWHKMCAAKLWTEAASSSHNQESTSKPAPFHEKPEPRFTHAHAQDPFPPTSSPNARHPEPDYFARPSHAHTPRRYTSHRNAEQSPDPRRRDMAADHGGRRRSFSDYANRPPNTNHAPPPGYFPTYMEPETKRSSSRARWHSHPRRQSSQSEEEDDVRETREKRYRRPNSPPPPSIRRFVRSSGNAQPQGAFNGPSSSARSPRLDSRVDDIKRRAGPSPLGAFRNKLSETVSNILPNGLTSERPRPGSRQNSGAGAVRPRRIREQARPSRLSRSYSDVDTEDSEDPATSESEARRRRRLRDEHERDKEWRRERERDHHYNGRVRDEWDDESETDLKRGKSHRRPDTQRRTSSHADIDRQRGRPEWDSRDRERLRDERRKWGRRLSPEKDMTNPAAAMAGRQMHAEAAHS